MKVLMVKEENVIPESYFVYCTENNQATVDPDNMRLHGTLVARKCDIITAMKICKIAEKCKSKVELASKLMPKFARQYTGKPTPQVGRGCSKPYSYTIDND